MVFIVIVTQIVPLTKSRSKIYIDEEFAFVLYKGELRSYRVKEQQEIEETVVEEILHTLLPKRAKLRCMNLLQSKDYTESQLRRKLSEGGYPESVIDEALDYVKSYHYVDDERYCKQYIEYQSTNRSRQRIITDLMHRGIEKELILQTYEEMSDVVDPDAELKQILKFLQKKKYDASLADYKEKQKIYASLARKGFGQEQIRRALDITL